MKGYGFIRKICICLGLVLLSSYITFSVKVNKIAKADTESRAECVIEAESRRIVYESHGDKRLPMASTTKILTALTVLETCEDLQEKVTIPKQAEGKNNQFTYSGFSLNQSIDVSQLLSLLVILASILLMISSRDTVCWGIG